MLIHLPILTALEFAGEVADVELEDQAPDVDVDEEEVEQ